MVIHLCEDVEDKMVGDLIKAGSDLKNDETLTIYFTCPKGGWTDSGEAIIHFINTNSHLITIIFYGEIFSTGMHIFLKTKCKKIILPDTRGMFHFSWQQMSINEGGKPSNDYDIFSLSEIKKSKQQSIDFLKTTKITPKELSSIKRGKDLFFTYERMLELL